MSKYYFQCEARQLQQVTCRTKMITYKEVEEQNNTL